MRRRNLAHAKRWLSVAAACALATGACADGDVGGSSEESVPPQAESPVPRQGQYVSRPEIAHPTVNVTVAQSTAPGLLFLTPKAEKSGQATTALIVDDDGGVVFAYPSDQRVTDLRVQRLGGEPVLTWWEGKGIDGRGDGEFVVMDDTYTEVARFSAGNGRMGDMHEFELTDDGTALILSYEPRSADLTAFGGPADGVMYEYYVQELDIETGEVLLEWRMSDHVSPSESSSSLPGTDGDGSARSPYDWAHVNSVAADGGTVLVSARNTSAVYAIDRTSGDLLWRLGGTQSDFEMGDGAEFSLQHDARRQPDGTISIFDNVHPATDESRALFLDVDEATGRAMVARELRHPDGIRANTQGNTQLLGTGGVFVGWGSAGRISEFSPGGEVVFDASLAPGRTYRAYRFEWEGRPTAPVDVVARPDGADGLDVYVSWNGATAVAEWRVIGGDDPDELDVLATVPKDGFEARIEVDEVDYIAVEALDQLGAVVGGSDTQRLR